MRATISKIHPLKLSRTSHSYIRVEFQLETGGWAKTDLVPKYRNYSRWKDIIAAGVGTTIGNLRMKRDNEVDADSYPSIHKEALKPHEIPKTKIIQGSLFQKPK